jgi:hypothetical protein
LEQEGGGKCTEALRRRARKERVTLDYTPGCTF